MTFRNIKLADLSEVITKGTTPTTMGYDFQSKGINFYKAQDLLSRYPSDTDTKISIECHDALKRSKIRKNDILVSIAGTIGRVSIWNSRSEANCNQAIAIIRCKPDVNALFSYYALTSGDVQDQIKKMTKTTAQPNLNLQELGSILIPQPSSIEQKSIVSILSSLDDKIEHNNKINKNLEELAQTLYKRWFVDFEFPNEDGEPYKSSGGEMVESELGLIPNEWYVDLLGNVVNITYGKNLPTKNLLLKGYPVFGGNGIIGYNDKFLYKNPKVLVSCRGAASGSVLNSLKNSFVTNNSLILEDNEKISYEYLKELSKNRSYLDFVSGSAQPQVTIASISKCKIIIPKGKTLNEFTKMMKESNEIIENIYYENLKLAQLRDELLPKLMNGEIEVPIEE